MSRLVPYCLSYRLYALFWPTGLQRTHCDVWQQQAHRLDAFYARCRVYVRTCDPEELPFMLSMEQEAASTAVTVVALSRSDAKYIEDNLLLPGASCQKVTVSMRTRAQTLATFL